MSDNNTAQQQSSSESGKSWMPDLITLAVQAVGAMAGIYIAEKAYNTGAKYAAKK